MRPPSFLTQFLDVLNRVLSVNAIVCLLQKDANRACWLYLVDLDTRWRLCVVKFCRAQTVWSDLVHIYTLKNQKHAAKSEQIKTANRKSVTMKVTASSSLETGI